MPVLSTVIVYNKSNSFGIHDDIALIETAIREFSSKSKKAGWTFSPPRHMDIKEPPVKSDIQIHVEMPVYANIAWSRINILIVNPDHYYPQSYDEYIARFDYVICKDTVTTEHFKKLCSSGSTAATTKVEYIPWTTRVDLATLHKYPKAGTEKGFVSFLAGSVNKCAAVEQVLPYWNTYPLTIYTTRSDFEKKLLHAANGNALVTIKCQDINDVERERLSRYYSGHLIVSHGEGFGHAAAKAFAANSFIIMNHIPVFDDMYTNCTNIGWISSSAEQSTRILPTMHLRDISSSLTSAFAQFEKGAWLTDTEVSTYMNEVSAKFNNGLHGLLQDILKNDRCVKGPTYKLPPSLSADEYPTISVITITYNRRNFADLCAYNLLSTDYPHEKIEWVVVDDSDDDAKSGSDKYMKFAADHPEFKLVYVPIGYKMSVGAKRNLGVEQASNDICLFMDDDDVYPLTSFRRRVAWLLGSGATVKGPVPDATVITTMAMYDLRDGRSAVNVPPWELPLGARISEASLCFRKSFWLERKFSEDAAIAEGEAWLAGRESRVLEIPPQQIIVALSHGNNSSSRRIPPGTPVGCAWGWPEQLVRFLHGLAGVAVESVGK